MGIPGIQAVQTLAALCVPNEPGLGAGSYGLFVSMRGAGAIVATLTVTLLASGDRRPWLIGGTLGMAAPLAIISGVDAASVASVAAPMLGFAEIVLVQNAIVAA